MDVYIAKASYDPPSEASANLTLPAMPFELFDALDKARVMQGDELYFEVSDYGQALMERAGSVITNYGLLERQDHQPMQTPLIRTESSGMEMS